MKGLHWLLYTCPSTRTKGHARVLNRLRHSNCRIHCAWVLKDEIAQFWTVTYKTATEKFLRRWITSPLRSGIPSLDTFVGSRTTHFDTMPPFGDCAPTNAIAEGINRIIKIVKNRTSRYRNPDGFTDISTSNV